jgi:O-antigen ligase
MSFSRTAIFGIVFASVIVFVLLNLRKSFFMKVVPVVLIILIVVLILVPPKKIYDTLYDFRKGSSIWRARLYSLTLNQAVKKPILGHGFKPRTEDFPVPIGSHSTYIGVVYKTGFLGFMVFCLFWGLVLRKWWVQKRAVNEKPAFYNLWIYTGIGLLSGILWMLTEDLDAPPIAAFLFFIVVGLALSLDKLKTSPEK